MFLSRPTQRDLVIVLEIERLFFFFFKAWLLLSLLEEKSSHVVFRGQDIIRYCMYLCFLKFWVWVSDDQWSQIHWKPKLFLKRRIVWFLSSSGQLSIFCNRGLIFELVTKISRDENQQP